MTKRKFQKSNTNLQVKANISVKAKKHFTETYKILIDKYLLHFNNIYQTIHEKQQTLVNS